MPVFFAFSLVFIGGGLGSICRYALYLLLRPWQTQFPWGTFAANALACLALGLLLGAPQTAWLSDQKRLLLLTGFCGGFSTYSTFTAETWGLWQNGQLGAALANALLHFGVCTVCLLLGLKITS
ncbi:MAG: fluoride efflux transporter CrcB [Saprospiraceae bacterium]|nr:fluoride efflux transporter CrcB [Saprospiraceae bacterium]